MKTFRAPSVKDEELRTVVSQIERDAQRADPFVQLEYLHKVPKKIRSGDMVLADGTDWDPGSGAGLYRRSEDNTTWVFIG